MTTLKTFSETIFAKRIDEKKEKKYCKTKQVHTHFLPFSLFDEQLQCKWAFKMVVSTPVGISEKGLVIACGGDVYLYLSLCTEPNIE